MKIYLVRHGESEGNVSKLVQTKEEHLTQKGKEQAKLLKERFKNFPIDCFLTSSFARARETSEILAGDFDVSFEETSLFGELQFPTEIQGLSYLSDAKSVLNDLFENYHDPSYRHSDEETFEDFKARGLEALEYIKNKDAEEVLVVTHGTLIKLFIGFVTIGEDIDSYQFNRLRRTILTSNTGVTAMEYRPDEVDKTNNGWRFLVYNDHSHLHKPFEK